jgi:uncharacterized UPF0160 family protein
MITTNFDINTEIVDIATHDGQFHADDVFATAIVCLLHADPRSGLNVVRTRNPELLKRAQIAVLDVGGVMKVSEGTAWLDHHQWRAEDPAGQRPCGAPYAAFGLAWDYFGKQLVAEVTKERDTEIVDRVWKSIDKIMCQPLDAADVGKAPKDANVYSMSRAISALNPIDGSPKDFDTEFELAVRYAATFMLREIQKLHNSAVSFERVKSAALAAIARGERFLVVEQGGVWQNPTVAANASVESGGIDYVIFQSPDRQWMCQCVPPEAGSFDKRLPLPEAWSAKRDEELREMTGVADAIFCHAGRFICGAKSKEGAIALATLALA